MRYTSDELKKALKEIAFDMQHFRCYVALSGQRGLLRYPTVHQAVVYSLLLHLRVLLGFFYVPPKHDDVWVWHFGETFECFKTQFEPISDPTPDDVAQVSKELHKRLAHLTATRWKKKAPSMDFYDKYFDAVEALIVRFRDALPDDVKAVFDVEMSRWERVHPASIDAAVPTTATARVVSARDMDGRPAGGIVLAAHGMFATAEGDSRPGVALNPGNARELAFKVLSKSHNS